MFTEADKNDDGKIDFDEFSAMMIPPVWTNTYRLADLQTYRGSLLE